MSSVSVSLFPWFRASFSYNEDNLIIRSNNAAFIFPAGHKKEVIPLKDISSCSVSTWYDIPSILVGVVAMVLTVFSGQFLIFGGILRVIITVFLALVGVFCFFGGFEGQLIIEKKGLATKLNIPFYSRATARKIANDIERIISTSKKVESNLS